MFIDHQKNMYGSKENKTNYENSESVCMIFTLSVCVYDEHAHSKLKPHQQPSINLPNLAKSQINICRVCGDSGRHKPEAAGVRMEFSMHKAFLLTCPFFKETTELLFTLHAAQFLKCIMSLQAQAIDPISLLIASNSFSRCRYYLHLVVLRGLFRHL